MSTAPVIRQTEFFPSTTAETIYAAILSGPKHTRMTGGKATAGTSVGDEFTAWDGYIWGENLELEPGKKIVQSWTTSQFPADALPSRVEWILRNRDDGAEVTLIHSGMPPDQAPSYEQGWVDFYWTPMKEYFAR